MKIEFDSNKETVTLDGIEMSFELLKHLANPDPAILYRAKRDGNLVTVECFHPEYHPVPLELLAKKG
jgi:hypothetical protein